MNDASTVILIVSFGVSLYVAWQVRTITRHYRQLALVPKIKRRLVVHLKGLEKSIDTKDWKIFRMEAAGVKAITGQAIHVVSSSARRAASNAHKKAILVTESKAKSFPKIVAEDLHLAMVELERQLDLLIEDKKWEW